MSSLQIQEYVELAPLTTIGVGGRARFFADVKTENALEEANAFAHAQHLPLFVLGGGSNLLVRDEGFPGFVVRLNIQGELQQTTVADRVRYDVPAGTEWDDFVLSTCKNDLNGIECLAGIPGLTGGTPVQNVGAYGQEVAQTITEVRAFDRCSRTFVVLSKEECRFGYRSSSFNTGARGRYLVTLVSFELMRGCRVMPAYAELEELFGNQIPTSMQVYQAVRELRGKKGMLLSQAETSYQSAGSFFKNPVIPMWSLSDVARRLGVAPECIPHWSVLGDEREGTKVKISAAWLVEKAGFPKGFVMGRAGTSARHSLALINLGGASFRDIEKLRDAVRSEVLGKSGVYLEQEPIELTSELPNNC